MPLTTDKFWKEQIKRVKAQHLDWGAERIAGELDRLAVTLENKGQGPIPSPPSSRTVARLLPKLWDPMSRDEQAQYCLLMWPETFERGDLPWEASAAALELLALSHAIGLGRPTVRNAKWYWRITVAAPTMPLFVNDGPCRYRLARWLAMWEVDPRSERPSDRRAFEWYLAYAPWANSGRADLDGVTWAARYESATKVPEPSGIPPIPRLVAELHSDSAGYAALAELIGEEWAGQVRGTAEGR